MQGFAVVAAQDDAASSACGKVVPGTGFPQGLPVEFQAYLHLARVVGLTDDDPEVAGV